MKASKRRIRNSEHKAEIRDKYKGVDPSEIEVIPADEDNALDIENRKMKVAAYVRVSTQNDEQTSSFELQVNDFTKRINDNPNWEFAGIYSDEGISGTELSHRKGMLDLIEDAKAGKVQLILVKSIARFARNVVDCLSIVQELKDYGVGVCFDENNLCTLGAEGTMLLTILATVAEEESRSKSFIMNWSIQRRFQNGIFLTPELLGYDKDENGELVINEDEAETIKVIYYQYGE
ncbi:MAG: recombinase family protein [Ruminococcus sp.]|nr:recombinase family protein [Ruminococcus sp.]